jgi:TPR repeat protein
MDWVFAIIALLIAALIFFALIWSLVNFLMDLRGVLWAVLGITAFAGAYIYIQSQLTGCEVETVTETKTPSEAKKPSETKKPSEAKKPSEDKKQSESEKPSDDGATATVRLAAEQGQADAQFAMGRRYEVGQGVPQNYFEAIKWYRLAAEQGHAKAQYNLGSMYREGRGVPPDFVQAYVWFSLAASGFPTSDAESRNSASQNRELMALRLTPAQLAEAQRLEREWKPKASAP